ncbi:MAG: TlpA disulfide reductase family protein [Bacteroidia bacterium]
MKNSLLALCAMILVMNSHGQPHYPKSGIKAPPIKVDEWVNDSITEKDLEGKTVVIEFWFTHCEPCIMAIPHLNKVEEKFKNDKVAFLAITFDNKEEVKNFQTKMYMASSVGTDTLKTTISAYDVNMFPTTVVIDTNGIISWAGNPIYLESVLDTVVKNQQNFKLK